MKSDHTQNTQMSGLSAQEVVYASTPEGLVAHGDLQAMYRFLMCEGALDVSHDQDTSYGDSAKNALFKAASNGLVKVADGRVMRISLYSWPVSVSFSARTLAPSEYLLAGGQNIQLLIKMRELWARAFQAKSGVAIAPLTFVTNLQQLLGVTPLAVRDALNSGKRRFAGDKNEPPYRFPFESERMEVDRDMPATYMFSAYVAWEVGMPEPDVAMDPVLRREMETLVAALFTQNEKATVVCNAGAPCVFHEAITGGQVQMLKALIARSVKTGRHFGLTCGIDGHVMRLTAVMTDGDETETEIQFCYSNIWRPFSHLQDLEQAVHHEQLRLTADARSRSERRTGLNEFQKAQREIH